VDDAIEIALQFVECINSKDIDGIIGMLAPGHLFVDLEGNEYSFDATSGRAAWSGYFKLAPRYLIHVSSAHAVGDTAILRGRTTGSHLGLPREQELREHALIWTAKVRAGKLADWRILHDTPAAPLNPGIPG
jgi:ketosteroid isomerase-like protein